MSASRTKFYLDKQNSKWLGVCSGIADYTGIDTTWVRVGAVLLTFATSGWSLLAYIVIACVAEKKPLGLYDSAEDAKFWQGVRTNPTRSTAEVPQQVPRHRPSPGRHRDDVHQPQQPPRRRDRQPALIGSGIQQG